MAKAPVLDEDAIEAQRTLMKLLQYVENECALAGFSTTSWLVSMSRSILADELTGQPSVQFDHQGQPRLN